MASVLCLPRRRRRRKIYQSFFLSSQSLIVFPFTSSSWRWLAGAGWRWLSFLDTHRLSVCVCIPLIPGYGQLHFDMGIPFVCKVLGVCHRVCALQDRQPPITIHAQTFLFLFTLESFWKEKKNMNRRRRVLKIKYRDSFK